MLIRDGEEVRIDSHGQQWRTAWHPPGSVPPGRDHGAAGICVVGDGRVVLVTQDGTGWDLPAGRPEAGESGEQTLRREVLEEACAVVTRARLLGYSHGRCVGGTETGLVLVRSIWRAEVDLLDWWPAFETRGRRVVTAGEARTLLPAAVGPVWDRAFFEAGLE